MMRTDRRLPQRMRLDDPYPDIAMYAITYESQGLRVKGLLALPQPEEPGGDSRPLPGLVYCRGGIKRVGMVQPGRLAAFARQGYAVFAPLYRGNEGGEGFDQFGGDDRHDVYEAIRLLRELPETDGRPVSLVGFSRGAIMAMMAARDVPDDVAAVAVWSGVSDLLLTYEERVDLRRMLKRVVGHPVKDAEAYRERSPVYWADAISAPVLIVHGTADDNVGAEHARRLAGALAAAGKPHEVLLCEGRGHVFLPEYEEQAAAAICEWFRAVGAAGG